MKIITSLVFAILLLLGDASHLFAQNNRLVKQCGTMQLLEQAFKENPSLKARFERQTIQFQQSVNKRLAALPFSGMLQDTITIPVVFHIVLPNPAIVTDAQIRAQLDVLNKDVAGLNSDSVNLPAGFKPLFGKSQMRFKLAQRTPGNEPATGIVRTTAAKIVYSSFDRSLKYSSLGGDDAWDRDRFFNVWVTNLSGGFVLGYATMPGTALPAEDGVVIHYTTLPADSITTFNRGRTLTHETGHFFYLYHIWGDENGCTGTDFVDDTPNQTTLTSGCAGGAIITDACSPVAPGILYQDYMDYSDDACMCLFTNGQVTRMETALNDYRAGYYTSNGAEPVPLFSLDATVRKIISPVQRACAETIAPVVTLRNRGVQPLSSADLYANIDIGPASVTHWTGNLLTLDETNIPLNTLAIAAEGNHVLKVIVTAPNGNTDQNTANDTITSTIQYYKATTVSFTEGFENNIFPAGWDLVNPDNAITWERVTGIAKTGNASVVIKNFDYQLNRQKDYLRLPIVHLSNTDSAFLSFQVAAAVKTNGSFWDTLQVLISTDCGNSYTSLYKKWGPSLITRNTASSSSFVPTASEWRKESVDLTPYINAGPFMLAFLNTTENQNNIYLDDIEINTTGINPNLRSKGFLVTPNPADGVITVQFYPYPANLKAIVIYNSSGQKVAEQKAKGAGNYSFDMRRFASAVYIVQAICSDKKFTQKLIKR